MVRACALTVLLVEDDAPLAQALMVHLRAEGWTVSRVANANDALSTCRHSPPDVVILDWMLPDRPGIEVCEVLRHELHPSPGVLMLTARGAEADVVVGLDHGADDFVVKPCRPRELVARVRTIARRLRRGSEPPEELPPIEHGPLRVDAFRRRSSIGEVELELTPTEHELLALFVSEPDRVFSRAELLQRVFDTNHLAYARNVDCHVARLRRKLKRAGAETALIRTMYGKGYMLSLDDR